MYNFFELNIESVVAYLFGITALFTIVMTVWAYFHQRRREAQQSVQARQPLKGDQGHFFTRARPTKN